MNAESGSSVKSTGYWELLVIFGLAFLSVLLPSGIVTGPSPMLVLISAIISLIIAFVVTVGYDRLIIGNRDRHPVFWAGVKTAYPVAFGVYLLALIGGFVSGASHAIQIVVTLLAAFTRLAAAIIRVRFRD